MALFPGSRHLTATLIEEYDLNSSGKRVNIERYLDYDRKNFTPDGFEDNIKFIPDQNSTPDMVANEIYGDASQAWIVMEFNDFIAQNPFIRFKGDEVLILPSRKTFYSEILNNEEV